MLQPGDTLNSGAYCIVRELGAGGFGVVYLADDVNLRRPVAIKTILPDIAAREPNVADAFFNEARTNAGLDHTNIIRVYFVGHEVVREAHVHYIVMEYVEGGDLEQLLDGAAVDLAERLEWMRQIADGLAHAHQRGVIHRDVKPRNVFVTKNRRAKVGDFGLAKAVGTETKTMMKGLGTPAYVSPEQIQNKSTDARCDVYSLGVMYFQILTGRLPYDAPDVTDSTTRNLAIMHQHLHGTIPSVRALNPAVPPAIDALVRRMMAKAASDRPASAAEVLVALDGASGELRHQRPGTTRWQIPWRVVAAVGGVLVVVVIGVAGFPVVKRALSSPDAATIQRDVADRLGQNGFRLVVDVTPDRVVALSGVVPDAGQRDKAIQLAKAVTGVRDVRASIEVPPDARHVERIVRQRLWQNGLVRITGDVGPDGTVTLTGVADNEADKTRARSLAAGVPGIRNVTDKITLASGSSEPGASGPKVVSPSPPPVPGPPAAPGGLKVNGAPKPSPGELQRLVSERLASRQLSVRVDVGNDRVAVLSGEVTDAAQKTTAVATARAVPGVAGVRDNIAIRETVAPPASPPDPRQLRQHVKQKLDEHQLGGLTVAVNPDRVVVLTGVVRTNVDRDRAIKVASVPGVLRVEARINCQQGPGCWGD